MKLVFLLKRRLRKISNTFDIKNKVVYRFFWGRGNLYKTSLHIIISVVSVLVIFTGFTSSFFTSSKASDLLDSQNVAAGNIDLLEQGGSIQTVLVSDNPFNFNVAEYVIKDTDTLDSISTDFGVSKDTIKWANQTAIDYYEEKVKPGDTLLIPEINGVLYDVKEGDSIDTVLGKVQNADRFKTIAINNLLGPDYKPKAGTKILIPDGSLTPPAKPVVFYPYQPSVSVASSRGSGDLSGVAFGNPLSNPACTGYSINQWYWAGHNGVDLGKNGGCPIRSVAAGTVIYAGNTGGGEGFLVKVDHGNGIVSWYMHGNGEIWVRVGDHVEMNTDLMYMGCTGYCTGTHLHISLVVNGSFIDPAPYIPF